jgi:hypothetical protein
VDKVTLSFLDMGPDTASTIIGEPLSRMNQNYESWCMYTAAAYVYERGPKSKSEGLLHAIKSYDWDADFPVVTVAAYVKRSNRWRTQVIEFRTPHGTLDFRNHLCDKNHLAVALYGYPLDMAAVCLAECCFSLGRKSEIVLLDGEKMFAIEALSTLAGAAALKLQ